MGRQKLRVKSADVARAMAAQDARETSNSAPEAVEDWTLRRWEAARTDRLNKAHWQCAHGQPINLDVANHLPALRAVALGDPFPEKRSQARVC